MVAPLVRAAMRRQGSQFTSTDLMAVLTGARVAISMDGRSAWRDDVFVERLWRSVTCEVVDLRAYEAVGEARASVGRYLGFFDATRPRSSLGGQTPDRAGFNQPMPIPAAA